MFTKSVLFWIVALLGPGANLAHAQEIPADVALKATFARSYLGEHLERFQHQLLVTIGNDFADAVAQLVEAEHQLQILDHEVTRLNQGTDHAQAEAAMRAWKEQMWAYSQAAKPLAQDLEKLVDGLLLSYAGEDLHAATESRVVLRNGSLSAECTLRTWHMTAPWFGAPEPEREIQTRVKVNFARAQVCVGDADTTDCMSLDLHSGQWNANLEAAGQLFQHPDAPELAD